MEADAVGPQLAAVRNGPVYPVAFGSQGPLVNLLQTEMVPQQMNPVASGAFAPTAFPSVPDEHRPFDRQQVREIVRGEC